VDGQNRLLGLTAYGKQILPSVRDLVRQYERLADAIAGTDNVQQVVRLGVGAFGAEHYVPKCLAMLQPETKGWLIEVAVCRGRDRILRTVQGDLNLAVVTHTPEQIGAALAEAGFHREALFVERLATHRMCLALWEKPKLAKLLQSLPADRPVSVSHLAQFELVGLDEQSGIRRQLEQWADQAKRPLYFVPGTEAGGWNAAHQFVLQGLGAAILPASMFTGEIQKGLVVRRIVDELAVSDYLIRRDEDSTAACEAVRSMLRKLGRELTKKGGAHSLR
jgi:DNA-binding transcriptional LysR family regulator